MSHKYRWSCVSAEVPWSPRDGAQLVSFQDKLFLLGGWNQYAADQADLAGGTGLTAHDPDRAVEDAYQLVAAFLPGYARRNALPIHAIARLPDIVRRAVLRPDDPEVLLVHDRSVHVPAAPGGRGRQLPMEALIRRAPPWFGS